MKIIGGITVTVALLVYGSLLNGWVLATLWRWFIASTFHTATLTIPQALGVAAVVTHLTFAPSPDKNDRTYAQSLVYGFSTVTVKCVMALLVGLVVKQWM